MNEMGRKELRAHLKEKGWSIEKLAAEMGVSFMTVYRWLSGKSNPSPLAKTRLKEITGLDW